MTYDPDQAALCVLIVLERVLSCRQVPNQPVNLNLSELETAHTEMLELRGYVHGVREALSHTRPRISVDEFLASAETNTARLDNPLDPRWAQDNDSGAGRRSDAAYIIAQLQRMIKNNNEDKANHGDDAYKRGVNDGREEAQAEIKSSLDKSDELVKLLGMLKHRRVWLSLNYKGEHTRRMSFNPVKVIYEDSGYRIVGTSELSGNHHAFPAAQIDSWESMT